MEVGKTKKLLKILLGIIFLPITVYYLTWKTKDINVLFKIVLTILWTLFGIPSLVLMVILGIVLFVLMEWHNNISPERSTPVEKVLITESSMPTESTLDTISSSKSEVLITDIVTTSITTVQISSFITFQATTTSIISASSIVTTTEIITEKTTLEQPIVTEISEILH